MNQQEKKAYLIGRGWIEWTTPEHLISPTKIIYEGQTLRYGFTIDNAYRVDEFARKLTSFVVKEV